MWKSMHIAEMTEKLIMLVQEVYRKSANARKVDKISQNTSGRKQGYGKDASYYHSLPIQLLMEAAIVLSLKNTEAEIILNDLQT